MAKFGFVLILLVHGAKCAFFDLTDVDDPLSLFWHSNKHFQMTQPCIVRVPGGPGSASVVTGQCKQKTLCLLSGGQPHIDGNCGSFLTCCTQSLVYSRRTTAKVSLFTNGAINTLSDSEFILEAQNDDVCQVRLDFEEFHLAASKEVLVQPDDGIAARECTDDYMIVTPSVYNIPRFCGNNNGQHVYVRLQSQRELRLHVHLATRSQTSNLLSNPRWRIRLTQLECPTAHNFFLKNKIHGSWTDFELLAPEGATQYFLEHSGKIRSFGFNGQDSDYISGLHYGISFKRRPNTNCIWFTTNNFMLRHTDAVNETNYQACIDYLFVPDAQEVSGRIYMFGSKLCSQQNDHLQVFYLNAPGPFSVFFHSAPNYIQTPTDLRVHAFDINYELRNC